MSAEVYIVKDKKIKFDRKFKEKLWANQLVTFKQNQNTIYVIEKEKYMAFIIT